MQGGNEDHPVEQCKDADDVSDADNDDDDNDVLVAATQHLKKYPVDACSLRGSGVWQVEGKRLLGDIEAKRAAELAKKERI